MLDKYEVHLALINPDLKEHVLKLDLGLIRSRQVNVEIVASVLSKDERIENLENAVNHIMV